ncbi:MAG TPA: autoinducer synthase, partial [Rhodobacterales bacterium]|nr:autoinducer synthase [Rhodobacterales bacterium]
MLRYVYGHDLGQFPHLAHSMFTDRAAQFKTRLGWDVQVNAAGEERDQYDDLDPLYVIWQREDGLHGGSMRFLPTTGRTMVNEHFAFLNDGAPITSPLIWECTRFCLSPKA